MIKMPAPLAANYGICMQVITHRSCLVAYAQTHIARNWTKQSMKKSFHQQANVIGRD